MAEYLKDVDFIAVCGNCRQGEYVARIGQFIRLLLSRGVRVGVRRRFRDYLAQVIDLPAGAESIETPEGASAVVSIGGDGTFLHTARWVGSLGVPVLGINTGHLGFLANYTIDETEELVDALLGGKTVVQRRSLLRICCPAMPEGFFPYALNEVALLKEETSSMISVNVEVDGGYLADYLADGLLVATPTGSTAYNLSVGGPILDPSLSCMVLSPVAPHTLTLRPIVIDGGSRLRAVVTSRSADFRVSVDGESFIAPCGTPVLLEPAPYQILTLRRPADTFSSTLRNKLLWGRR